MSGKPAELLQSAMFIFPPCDFDYDFDLLNLRVDLDVFLGPKHILLTRIESPIQEVFKLVDGLVVSKKRGQRERRKISQGLKKKIKKQSCPRRQLPIFEPSQLV